MISEVSITPGRSKYSKSENFDWSVVAVLRVKEGRQILVAVRLAAPMTANAEEENNPPEMVEVLWQDGSVGRALEYQSKGRGFESHSSRSFRTSTTHLHLA